MKRNKIPKLQNKGWAILRIRGVISTARYIFNRTGLAEAIEVEKWARALEAKVRSIE